MKNSNLISIVTASVLLFLIGVMLLVMLRSRSLSAELRAQSRVVVELDPESKKSEQLQINNWLAARDEVDPSTIKQISRDEAYQEMYDVKLSDDGENPFYDIILFGLRADHYSDDTLDQLESSLSEMTGVMQVIHDLDSSQEVESTISRFQRVLLFGSLAILLLIVFVLYNVFKIRLISREEEIRIMELVGATPKFVRQPFINEAFKISMFSTLGAVVLLGLLVVGANAFFAPSAMLFSWRSLGIAAISVILIGLTVVVCTTYILVNLYLKSLYKS